MQEFKEERKQNVRFADIVTKPINIHFSKSDSDEDSNTNVSDPLNIAIQINSMVMSNQQKKIKHLLVMFCRLVRKSLVLIQSLSSNRPI